MQFFEMSWCGCNHFFYSFFTDLLKEGEGSDSLLALFNVFHCICVFCKVVEGFLRRLFAWKACPECGWRASYQMLSQGSCDTK